MSPKELLTLYLNSHQKALNKSRLSVFYQKIDYPTYKLHRDNLIPLIKQYIKAIKCLG